jgi:5-methylcytosine-specific restriction endonuclease McrA
VPVLSSCRECSRVVEQSAENFPRDRSKSSGLSTLCKWCNREACKRRRDAAAEKVREGDRKRYRDDAGRQAAVRRAAKRHYEEHAVERRAAARNRADQKTAEPVQNAGGDVEVAAGDGVGYAALDWHQRNPGRRRRHSERYAGRVLPPGEDYSAEDVVRRMNEQDGKCAYCGRPFTASGPLSSVVDHIVPLSRGGRNDAANIAVVHRGCNESKGRQRVATFFGRFDRPGFSREDPPLCLIGESAFTASATLVTPRSPCEEP